MAVFVGLVDLYAAGEGAVKIPWAADADVFNQRVRPVLG